MNKPAANKSTELLDVINLDDAVAEARVNRPHYADDQIGPDREITLHFSLALADKPDALIDSNFAQQAVRFRTGDGSLLPGFEQVLFGLKAGAKQEFIIPAVEAFGLRNTENIQLYPRYQFPADLPMEKGLMINFSDVGGNEQAGVISDFNADQVTVDFNHPLADQDILFTVAIKSVEPV